MKGGSFDESSTSDPTPSSTTNSGPNNDAGAGDFECNICFELAQDPIVTLCGHLYCWPCLYRWLTHHSQSQECPVCKATVQQHKLVPLYGRGKTTTDPRSRPVAGDDNIPHRPSGQRPETAQLPPRPAQSYFSNLGFGFLGGFMPMATARLGNVTMSAGFGGLFPSLLSFQFNGTMYGGGAAAHGFPYGGGYSDTVNGVRHAPRGGVHGGHGFHHYHGTTSQGQDSLLKHLLLFVGFLVLLTFLWS